MPGGIAGLHGPRGSGSLKFETVNMVMSPAGLGNEKDCFDEAQQQL
jgi:hypothetical protein